MKKKELLMIGLMVFSIFFGAGNLIFPPIIGKQAGTSVFTTMFFFSITAIIFPILGIVAVAKSDGLRNLANRVDPIFSIIFTIAAYLAILCLLKLQYHHIYRQMFQKALYCLFIRQYFSE